MRRSSRILKKPSITSVWPQQTRVLGVWTRHIARSPKQTRSGLTTPLAYRCPDDHFSSVSAAQIDDYQAALRLAGHRDHADEAADFGAASDNVLHAASAGLPDNRARVP